MPRLVEFAARKTMRRGGIEALRTKRRIVFGFFLVSIWILLGFDDASAFEVCGDSVDKKNQTDYCPSGNTCCRMLENNGGFTARDGTVNDTESWGCIASDMGARNATCCSDNDNTGCPSGYNCRIYQDASTGEIRHDCVRSIESSDPFMKVLPRYQLCRAEENNRKLYGLTVPARSPRTGTHELFPKDPTSQIAYYSNLGPIECEEGEQQQCDGDLQGLFEIEMALIVVHGANRNADDYFCSAKATIELQDRYQWSAVLVIAPLFLLTPPTDALSWLYWNDIDDKDGSWRYGADSTGPTAVSSFAAMDAIISNLRHSERFPNLRNIVVAGHSSGGQFVQRWSLLTPDEVWPEVANPIQLHAIVANPSSYAYLTPLRFFDNNDNEISSTRLLRDKHNFQNGVWEFPKDDCPGYNQWEWGLDDGGDKNVPYRQRIIAKEGPSKIVQRYLHNRSVVYMIGNLDRCSEGDEANGKGQDFCDSHGLETTCADELQGSNRYERNVRYWNSLEMVGSTFTRESKTIVGTPAAEQFRSGRHKHRRRVVVPNVGHDHSMMFQSAEGIDAIYN